MERCRRDVASQAFALASLRNSLRTPIYAATAVVRVRVAEIFGDSQTISGENTEILRSQSTHGGVTNS